MSTLDQDAIRDALDAHLTISPDPTDALEHYATLEIAPLGDGEWDSRFEADGSLRLVVRLLTWERREGQATIRDIKEQAVRIPAPLLLDVPRLEQWLAAHAAVLARALADADRLALSLPAHLIFIDALRLKRPKTAQQFERALAVPSRLGRLL